MDLNICKKCVFNKEQLLHWQIKEINIKNQYVYNRTSNILEIIIELEDKQHRAVTGSKMLLEMDEKSIYECKELYKNGKINWSEFLKPFEIKLCNNKKCLNYDEHELSRCKNGQKHM